MLPGLIQRNFIVTLAKKKENFRICNLSGPLLKAILQNLICINLEYLGLATICKQLFAKK
jgi:hypothetical protein